MMGFFEISVFAKFRFRTSTTKKYSLKNFVVYGDR